MVRHWWFSIFLPLTVILLHASVVQYSYDSLNRLTSATYADGTTIVYTYDVDGNRISQAIANSASPQPGIGLDKTNLVFSLARGETSTAQPVTLTNTGGGNLQWNAVSSTNWLSVTPSSGTNGVALSVTASAVGLTRGSYPGSIQILASASNSPLTISVTLNVTGTATMSLSRSSLNFSSSGTLSTTPQQIGVNFTGSALNWTASSNQSNITVFPTSGVGNGSLMVAATAGPSGVVTVSAPGATNSPQQVQVNVTSASNSNPYGSFDTPLDNSIGIAGAIPITGWALDDIEVASVGIWREPIGNEPASSNGLVFIGTGTFVSGARPDVEHTYPNAPMNYRAGWGYMMLTNFLPDANGSPGLGNGTYKIHAIAVNKAGAQLDLGTRTITVDNAHASKPFGTIDTPDQGATISGNAYVNFGWALTQNPYCIPTDGSTMIVWIDGALAGHPTYNQRRSDIVSLFPGLCNTNGAVGFFYMDTTKLANGVHTISWAASDNAGRSDGMGSRYFTVQNSGQIAAPAVEERSSQAPVPGDGVKLRRGHNVSAEAESLALDQDGLYSVEMEEVDRIELHAEAARGYLLVGGEKRDLPIGSTLKDGVFYWQPGPGFLGKYDLLLIRSGGEQVQVRVKIQPKVYGNELK